MKNGVTGRMRSNGKERKRILQEDDQGGLGAKAVGAETSFRNHRQGLRPTNYHQE
jgi:hypothetical protein